jgi:eukaryotic-like serine/threonine-protein kinase
VKELTTFISTRLRGLGTRTLGFGRTVQPKRIATALVALAVTVFGLGFVTDRLLTRAIESQISNDLKATLGTAVAGIDAWLDENERAAGAAAGDARVRTVAGCVDGAARGWLCSTAELGAALSPYLRATDFSGYALFERDPESADGYRLHAAMGSLATLLLRPSASLAQRLRWDENAEPQFLPPFLLEKDRPVSFLMVALGRIGRRRERTLIFEVPLERFTRVLEVARVGASGETYAIDRQGWLLSESRFARDLRAAGFISTTHPSAILRMKIRDPGVDLRTGARPSVPRVDQPLTQLANQVTQGREAVYVQGYRDYRGVPVVGAGTWLADRSFGVITEINTDEAFHSVETLRRIYFALITLIAASGASLVVLAFVAGRTRARAAQAEKAVEALGQYQIVRKLGEGGMGTVYLATHALLRRPTAVKLLRADRRGPDSTVNFEREVRSTSELCHPNTVAIYDYGRTPEGLLYYAMEYLEGTSFESLVRNHGPLPAGRVIYLLRQVCGSLAEAHARGLCHRDIKPANLFVSQRGGIADMVKVLDFGLARWYRAETDPGEDNLVVGTPEYMAPELFESAKAARAASDIYSVGAVGYFLLTGTPVFPASSLSALSTAHLTRQPEPPSRRLGRPVDPTLERTILACLAKDPAARPASAEALGHLLAASPEAGSWTERDAEEWWRGRQVSTPPLPAPEARGFPIPAIVRPA